MWLMFNVPSRDVNEQEKRKRERAREEIKRWDESASMSLASGWRLNFIVFLEQKIQVARDTANISTSSRRSVINVCLVHGDHLQVGGDDVTCLALFSFFICLVFSAPPLKHRSSYWTQEPAAGRQRDKCKMKDRKRERVTHTAFKHTRWKTRR